MEVSSVDNSKTRILMTGATGGLGRVICKDLFKLGMGVTNLFYSENKLVDDLNLTAEKCQVGFKNIQHDFSKNISEGGWEKILGSGCEYDHLIFVHGNCIRGDMLDLTPAQILESMQVNFVGPFGLCQFLLKSWSTSKILKDRSITYVSTVATKGGSPDEVAYHSSKKAMESALLSMARGFAQKNIRVNVVSPGLLDTSLGKATLERRPDVLSRIPLGKITKTDDVSRMVMTLILSESITGQNIHVNSGRYFSL